MARPLIVVDPGHGGTDPGAENDAQLVYESELNLDLALLFMLRSGPGFDVLLTRTSDATVSLADRATFSNVNDADAFLSFHCNAAVDPSARGFEVWTTPGETKADALAASIFAALVKACPEDMPARADYDDGDPDKEARFYVLRNTDAPAVLIEFGFVSNDEEALWLDDIINQFALVEAVAEGVRFWLKGKP